MTGAVGAERIPNTHKRQENTHKSYETNAGVSKQKGVCRLKIDERPLSFLSAIKRKRMDKERRRNTPGNTDLREIVSPFVFLLLLSEYSRGCAGTAAKAGGR